MNYQHTMNYYKKVFDKWKLTKSEDMGTITQEQFDRGISKETIAFFNLVNRNVFLTYLWGNLCVIYK